MSLARAHVGLNKSLSFDQPIAVCIFPIATPHGLLDLNFAHEHGGVKYGEGGGDRCALCYLSISLNQSFTTAVDRAFLYIYIYTH